MSDLLLLLDQEGIVLLSTPLSNNHIKPGERITWWYASPRNGHTSLFSRDSFCHLAARANFNFASFLGYPLRIIPSRRIIRPQGGSDTSGRNGGDAFAERPGRADAVADDIKLCQVQYVAG